MNWILIVSYGLAACAYAALFAMLATAWGGRRSGLRLLVASAITSAWAAVMAVPHAGDSAASIVFMTECIRQAAWIVVVAGLLSSAGWPGWLSRLAYSTSAVIIATVMAAALSGTAWFNTAVLLGGLYFSVLGLMLLEQAFRNSEPADREAFRYLYIGVGGMFAYDLFIYSQGLLLGALSPEAWTARGFVFALTLPFVAVAAKRMPAWSLRVFVSRQVTFYSTTFLAIGGYLLLMAAGGYVVRVLGGAWGPVAQITFLAAAAALLAGLTASSTLRGKFRVFLFKHFYRHKYDYRDEWLRFIATLSDVSATDDPRNASVRAVAQIISSPSATLLRHDAQRGTWQIVTIWPETVASTDPLDQVLTYPELLSLLDERDWVVDLDEHRDGSALEGELALPKWLLASHWRLIVPIQLRNELFGALVLADPPGRFQLTYEDRDLLKTAARHIATHLAQHEAEQRVAESQQFEAYSKLAAFMMHDLKNSIAQLQLVVDNAQRHRDKPEFIDDAIETVRNTTQRITRLMDQLHRGADTAQRQAVELGSVIQDAVALCSMREPRPALEPDCCAAMVVADRERLSNVLQHLIRNAQDATPVAGTVRVGLQVLDGRAIVEVKDTGAGMTPEFVRDRLFRPFYSSKGAKGMGVGAYQAREYARSLGGDIEVRSAPGSGTSVRFIMPVSAPS